MLWPSQPKASPCHCRKPAALSDLRRDILFAARRSLCGGGGPNIYSCCRGRDPGRKPVLMRLSCIPEELAQGAWTWPIGNAPPHARPIFNMDDRIPLADPP